MVHLFTCCRTATHSHCPPPFLRLMSPSHKAKAKFVYHLFQFTNLCNLPNINSVFVPIHTHLPKSKPRLQSSSFAVLWVELNGIYSNMPQHNSITSCPHPLTKRMNISLYQQQMENTRPIPGLFHWPLSYSSLVPTNHNLALIHPPAHKYGPLNMNWSNLNVFLLRKSD